MAAHSHSHDHPHGASRQLVLALTLTLLFAGVEVVGGLWSGSLTLLGDAGHMVSDAFSLGIAAFAARLATRPPTYRHSYGLGRAEVVAAMLNAMLMLGVVGVIVVEAFERLVEPSPVMGPAVMAVAAVGLGVNLLVAYILHRGESNLNVRAAMLHVMGDLLGSVAAIVAGAVIAFTGWTPIDPLLAMLVCALILYSTVHLLRESLHVVMEGVPRHLELPAIGQRMATQAHVESVHDLHIWSLASGTIALSAHVVVDRLEHWPAVLEGLQSLLAEHYGIEHVTLQPEPGTVTVPLERLDSGNGVV